MRCEEKIEWTEHPDNIEIRGNRPAPDKDFLKRRTNALNMVLDTPELRELIADIVDLMFEGERNQLWWVSQYLKAENMWYDEDATVMDIESRLYEEAIVEQEETFDTAFAHMLRCIKKPSCTTLENGTLDKFHTPDDMYHFVIFNDPRLRIGR